jgi:hypothetical protein
MFRRGDELGRHRFTDLHPRIPTALGALRKHSIHTMTSCLQTMDENFSYLVKIQVRPNLVSAD